MNMKKLISAIICAALLLCVAGCGSEPAAATTPSIGASTPEAAGVLFVSIGAEYKVIYDTDGLVIAADGMTDSALDVLAAYTDITGTACDTAVSELVKRTIDGGQHPKNRVVVIKQAPDSSLPTANFLEDVRLDAAAVTDFEVVLIPADTLTAEGYITPDAAKDILTRQLKLTEVAITCSEVFENVYTLTFELDGAEQEYDVDAVTGTVYLYSTPTDAWDPNLDGMDGEIEYEGPIDSNSDPANDDFLDAPQDPE